MRLAFLGLLAAVAACAHTGGPAPPTTWRRPPSDSLQLNDSSAFTSSDVAWAMLAAEIPGGFAGVFVNDDGRLVLVLTQPEQAPAVMSALVSRDVLSLPPGVHLHDAIVQRARWDFSELFDWARYVGARIGSAPASFDLDEKNNRIAVSVAERQLQTTRAKVQALQLPAGLVRIDGQPPICYSDMVPAVRVWAKDADTEAPVNAGAKLRIQSATATDSVVGSTAFPSAPLAAGIGKTGVFDVVVMQTGYQEWRAHDVRVMSDGCYPITVELTALMRR